MTPPGIEPTPFRFFILYLYCIVWNIASTYVPSWWGTFALCVCVTATFQIAFLAGLLTRYVSGVGNLRDWTHLIVHTYPVGLLPSLLAQVHYLESWGDIWEGIRMTWSMLMSRRILLRNDSSGPPIRPPWFQHHGNSVAWHTSDYNSCSILISNTVFELLTGR